MFKKFSRSEDVGSYSKVKSSEQRKIRKCISEQYPNEDASFDIVFKKKSPMNLANHNHVQLIACENNQVWFFSFRKMEYVPTLRTLHKFPQMLPIVQLDRGAIKFILGGANIMCPGLTSAGGRMESALEEGDICAIYAEGKENALAIGQMKMSTERIRAENRGIGVEVLHILNDGLWAMPSL